MLVFDKFFIELVNLINYYVGIICVFIRVGFFMGRNCNRNGVWYIIMGVLMFNVGEIIFVNVFNENGYKIGMFGKWYLGDNYFFLLYD